MSKVEITGSGAVRRLLLNRPEKRNALDREAIAVLTEALSEAPAEAERVTVLAARGAVFSAGLDFDEGPAFLADPAEFEALLAAVEAYPLPVVAIVQGAAIAGGAVLALSADFVVASDAAVFAMSATKIGTVPPWSLTQKLVEIAGPVATRELLLLGAPIPAAELYRFGAIARLAASAELEATAAVLIETLAANAPLSLRTIKRQIARRSGFREAIDHADLDAEARAVMASADALEGVAARREKRQPKFEGR
ncbi:MAG: enoyl-CoA hydratase/isomerase family protein [Alphaproteobacteria bacterium]|jgi:enoyl-CoA hydratase/carnithine racemase|nr:enoyl-CoA hydratase/isomerase family protein [Alphaproteobacteria bacterium]